MESTPFLLNDLPDLALQDGDVIIHMSRHAGGILVVHKDVLVSNSRYFKAALSEAWGRSARPLTAGATAPVVYEMDLLFDPDACLALPVIRGTHKLTSLSPLKDKSTTSSATDTSIDTSTAVKKPFLWNEPQKLHHSYVDENCTFQFDRLYHNIFAAGYKAAVPAYVPEPYPGRRGWSKRSPRVAKIDCKLVINGRTHPSVVAHMSMVWKCLLLMIYGHDVVLPASGSWQHQVIVVTNLHMYAEILGLRPEVMQRIGNMLMSLDNLWYRVSQEPAEFLFLGYHFKLPHLYIDAVKHLVACHWSRYLRLVMKCCSEETYSLLMAAKLLHNEHTAELITELCSSPLFRDFEINCRGWGDCNMGVSRAESAKYGSFLKSIIMLDLERLVITNRLGGSKVDFFGDEWESMFGLCRWLQEEGHLLEVDDIKWIFNLEDILRHAQPHERRDLDIDKLASAIGALLHALKYQWAMLARSTTCHRLDYTDGQGCFGPAARDILADEGRACDFCAQARHQEDDIWAYVDPTRLFADRERKPWPLNGQLGEPAPTSLDTIELVPATFPYLQSIGLGRPFRHLAHRGVVGLDIVEEDVWSGARFDLHGLY